MLDLTSLQELHDRHRNTKVLSVYLDADQHDFRERRRWRVELDNGLRRAGAGLSAEDAGLFNAAREHLEAALHPDANEFLTGRGWVGFAHAAGLIHAEDLPVPMPNLVRWTTGPRLAAYTRALKQQRAVIGVVIDARRARIVRYRTGTMAQLDRLHGDTYLGDLTDIPVSKRAAETTGVRGKTGTDAAQHLLEVERDRLVARVVTEVADAADTDQLVIAGGPPTATAALLAALEGAVPAERIRRRDDLSFDLSDAELRAVLEEEVSAWNEARQRSLVDRITEAARSHGGAVLGEHDTTTALQQQRVRLLAFADSYREHHPDRVDVFVAAAFGQDAELEEVGRTAGERLVEAGGGVGALLHYRP